MIVNLIYQSKNSVYTQCYSSSLYLQKDIIIAGIFFFYHLSSYSYINCYINHLVLW